jgi:hypothetical protein
VFSYDTAGIPDRMILTYEGSTVFDSTCIGTNGARNQSIRYAGTSSIVTVQVIPNCASPNSTGTAWAYTVMCPN